MHWNRSNAIGVARNSCAYCSGNGTRKVRKHKEVPCHCVFRAVFRACYNKFRECVATGEHISPVTLVKCGGREGLHIYSRVREEYIADFCLVSRRVLDEEEYRVFRMHFLLGADWRLCCRQMKLERGDFFHFVYRIEQKLGRTFAELKPYPLFPLDQYFGGMIRKAKPTRREEAEPSFQLPLSA